MEGISKSGTLKKRDLFSLRKLNFIFFSGKEVSLWERPPNNFLLSKEELKGLQIGLKQIIKNSEDDVRIYPLLSNVEAIIMGKGDKVPEGVWIFLD